MFQVDGTSDIMRGQATEGGATATEQAIKAKYGSIRGGKAQKRFARFCSEAQSIRGEIICKHFSSGDDRGAPTCRECRPKISR
jgi:hypothetical protein